MIRIEELFPYHKKLGAVEIAHEECMEQLDRALQKKIVFLQAGEK